MGKPWASDLEVVTPVPSGDQKPVTLVLPYYENAGFFHAGQIATWRTAAYEPMRPFVSVIVVDDGSPDPARLPDDPPFPMRLFRIERDVRWNWLAARNIGAHQAPDGWVLLTDMDHIVPAETFTALVTGAHDPGVIYTFSRREHTGEPLGPHPNSWFLTREMFWRVGGYDETLSGHYGTDGDWRRRCATTAPIKVLSDVLVRHEYQGDSSTQRYQRKQPQDAAVKAIVAKRGAGWRPKVLSFPYAEVTA